MLVLHCHIHKIKSPIILSKTQTTKLIKIKIKVTEADCEKIVKKSFFDHNFRIIFAAFSSLLVPLTRINVLCLFKMLNKAWENTSKRNWHSNVLKKQTKQERAQIRTDCSTIPKQNQVKRRLVFSHSLCVCVHMLRTLVSCRCDLMGWWLVAMVTRKTKEDDIEQCCTRTWIRSYWRTIHEIIRNSCTITYDRGYDAPVDIETRRDKHRSSQQDEHLEASISSKSMQDRQMRIVEGTPSDSCKTIFANSSSSSSNITRVFPKDDYRKETRT